MFGTGKISAGGRSSSKVFSLTDHNLISRAPGRGMKTDRFRAPDLEVVSVKEVIQMLQKRCIGREYKFRLFALRERLNRH